MAVAVRLKKPWKKWPSGHVFTEMPENVATALTKRGIGERVTTPPARKILHANRGYETKASNPLLAKGVPKHA
jgi:hypothetical protein